MQIETHLINEKRIAEVKADKIIVITPQDGLDILADIYYQGFEGLILHQDNITPDFFDLKTGIAGEILQKFSNYRMKLALVGDFSIYTSKSLKDFIFESNRNGQVSFVATISEALKVF